jgi:hypothetical protein
MNYNPFTESNMLDNSQLEEVLHIIQTTSLSLHPSENPEDFDLDWQEIVSLVDAMRILVKEYMDSRKPHNCLSELTSKWKEYKILNRTTSIVNSVKLVGATEINVMNGSIYLLDDFMNWLSQQEKKE